MDDDTWRSRYVAFGNLVLDDLDAMLDDVERTLRDTAAAAHIVDSIERLHADYAEWFREDMMRLDAASEEDRNL